MKKIQPLVKLGQIFAVISMMWSGPLPTALALDLTASSNIPTVTFDDTDISGVDWRIRANNGGNKLSIEQVNNNGIPFTTEANAPNNSLYINQAGNIGIGTSTPTRPLTVARSSFPDVNNAPAVRFQDISIFPFQWTMLGDFRSFRIQDDISQTVPFAIDPAAPQDSFVIAPGPRIGIGTDTPETQLHIAGTGTDTAQSTQDIFNGIGPHPEFLNGPAFNFGYSGASYGRGSGFFNTRPDPQNLSVPPNPSLRFATRDLQRMIIAHNGFVGIGNFFTPAIGQTPASLLHVKGGDIRVEGGSFIDDNVTLNVPDYVFAPDYPLLPLNDLQTYIEREKRLPEMPSAQEIKQHGVKLGEMQMQLLKKIEELTLYTLQQEKTIHSQGEKLTTLQEQNQELKTQNGQLHNRLSAIEALVKDLARR